MRRSIHAEERMRVGGSDPRPRNARAFSAANSSRFEMRTVPKLCSSRRFGGACARLSQLSTPPVDEDAKRGEGRRRSGRIRHKAAKRYEPRLDGCLLPTNRGITSHAASAGAAAFGRDGRPNRTLDRWHRPASRAAARRPNSPKAAGSGKNYEAGGALGVSTTPATRGE